MGAPWSGEIGKVRRVPEGGSRTTDVVVIDALPSGELLSGWQRHLNRFLDGGRSFCETASQHHRERNQDNQRAPHDRIEGSPATPVEETCSSACTARGGIEREQPQPSRAVDSTKPAKSSGKTEARGAPLVRFSQPDAQSQRVPRPLQASNPYCCDCAYWTAYCWA